MHLGAQLFGVLANSSLPLDEALKRLRDIGYTHVESIKKPKNMEQLKSLNKRTAPKSVMPERIIQFGEGNFLRAFVDWIVWNMNQKTNFNGSVVIVQPIERGMVDWLNGQDCLYHVNLQGRLNGEAVNTLERIDVVSRALNPYSQNPAFMALAEQPEIRFVISNTTEAGIAFDDTCKFTDAPASSYPGKLVQLLFHRYQTFNGDPTKGLIIMPCELIFLNGHHLKEWGLDDRQRRLRGLQSL